MKFVWCFHSRSSILYLLFWHFSALSASSAVVFGLLKEHGEATKGTQINAEKTDLKLDRIDRMCENRDNREGRQEETKRTQMNPKSAPSSPNTNISPHPKLTK